MKLLEEGGGRRGEREGEKEGSGEGVGRRGKRGEGGGWNGRENRIIATETE